MYYFTILRNTMILKKNQYVINKKMPQWGLGKVINIINQELTEVFFEHSGYHKFYRKNNPLSESELLEHQSTIFENLSAGDLEEDKKGSFQNLALSQENFVQEFPQGFSDPKYIQRERTHKEEAHALAAELLDQKKLEKLIQAKAFEEISANVLKVTNKLTLLLPNEKTALREGLKEEAVQEEFALSLFALLYGSDEMESRFDEWAKTLKSIDIDKWTTATYFLFLVFPQKYMFVKPNITQAVATMSAFNIAFTPRINWRTYERILRFSDYTKQKLHALEPKDMIDIQSFMWSIMAYEK